MEKLRSSNVQEIVIFEPEMVGHENAAEEYRQIMDLPGTAHDKLLALAGLDQISS